jgi:hypothetical protein
MRHGTRVRSALAAVTAGLMLLGSATSASGHDLPESAVRSEPATTATTTIACGPARLLPERGQVRFCGQAGGKMGGTGEYVVADKRYAWSDRWHLLASDCVLAGHYLSTDGIQADFVGFPHLHGPSSVYVPGTQYRTAGQLRSARIGYFDFRDDRFHPTEPWRPVLARGDQYPPSGPNVPPTCDYA